MTPLNEKGTPIRRWTSQPSPIVTSYEYLTGYRGLLVMLSFLWTFMITFVPTAVAESANSDGPSYQVFLRKIVSVLLWNESLIYSSVIYLSARTICLPFLQNPTAEVVASAVFRRTVALLIPVAVAVGVIQLTFSQTGTKHISDFLSSTGNESTTVPYQLPGNLLGYFNAVFNLFWTTREFSTQAGATMFPTGTLWIIDVVYMESYTIYMAMIIIPYTRKSWRVQAWTLVIFTAWWVQSWAWYSITGLLIADAKMNMEFMKKSNRGLKIYGNIRMPSEIIYLLVMAVGLLMQYIWTAWKPEMANYELMGHTGMYYTGSYNSDYDASQPQARDDIYLIVIGFNLVLETSKILQAFFQNPVLVYLGRRSYSIFLLQSFILFTVGMVLFSYLKSTTSITDIGANLVVFFVSLFCTGMCAEVYYWLVDLPARRCAERSWAFLTC